MQKWTSSDFQTACDKPFDHCSFPSRTQDDSIYISLYRAMGNAESAALSISDSARGFIGWFPLRGVMTGSHANTESRNHEQLLIITMFTIPA